MLVTKTSTVETLKVVSNVTAYKATMQLKKTVSIMMSAQQVYILVRRTSFVKIPQEVSNATAQKVFTLLKKVVKM